MRAGNHDSIGRLNVTHLSNAAAEAAFNPPDGSVAYRDDLQAYRVRRDTLWHSVVLETTAPLDIYVDPVGGSDTNDGLTTLTPFQTLTRADLLVPLVIRHRVNVHLASGAFPISRTYFLSARIYESERIEVFADEVWDPAVFINHLTAVGGVGSSSSVIKGAFVVGEHDARFVRVTSGAAAGRIVLVRNTTATDIVPVAPLVGFVAGDGYEVLSWNCTIAPSGSSFQIALPGSGSSGWRFGEFVVTAPVFRGIAVDGTTTTNGVDTIAHFIGVRLARYTFVSEGAEMVMGDPLSTMNALWLGWGVCWHNSVAVFPRALEGAKGFVHGYWTIQGIAGGLSYMHGIFAPGSTWLGGRMIDRNHTNYNLAIDGNASTPVLCDLGIALGGEPEHELASVTTQIPARSIAGLTMPAGTFRLDPGLRAIMTSTVTGAPSVSIDFDVQVYFNGQPALDGWDVGDGMGAVLGSFFDAVGVDRSFKSRRLERIS